jgi:ribulose-5-phosphate 4-epimerase/fuculose-1-phosphate aldolase
VDIVPSEFASRFNPNPQRKDWFDPEPPRTVEEERLHRQQRLAGAYRIFANEGFGQGLAGHITARDPEYKDYFWVNPWGMHFSRIKVSDLLLVNANGEIMIGKGPLNRAAFAIHAALHEARPDVDAAAHTHSLYGKAWSTLKRKLDPLTQDACVFYGQHEVFDEYTGVVLDLSEGERIAKVLGDKRAVILANHGLLSTGPTVESACWWYILLENVCHAQILAEAAGTPIPIDHATAAKTHQQIGRVGSAQKSFEALYDVLLATDDSFLG